MSKKNDSPCVSVCQFDGRTGWCAGCGCTPAEIRQWRKVPPFRRTALDTDLKRRLRVLSNAGGETVRAGKRGRTR